MSKESSKSTSTGASNSTRRTSQPLDDMPKLVTNEQESGFGGDMTNPSEIAGETETGQGGAASGSDTWAVVPVPSPGAQTKIAYQNVMGQDTAIQGGEIPTEDQGTNRENRTYINGDGNLTVVSLNETEGVVPVLEAANANGQQERSCHLINKMYWVNLRLKQLVLMLFLTILLPYNGKVKKRMQN